jgi:hypothetical protein
MVLTDAHLAFILLQLMVSIPLTIYSAFTQKDYIFYSSVISLILYMLYSIIYLYFDSTDKNSETIDRLAMLTTTMLLLFGIICGTNMIIGLLYVNSDFSLLWWGYYTLAFVNISLLLYFL